jgi:hypothetical protein
MKSIKKYKPTGVFRRIEIQKVKNLRTLFKKKK